MNLETEKRDSAQVEQGRTPSLFKRIGGADAVSATVEKFYERVVDDPELRPFFAKTNMKWLEERQKRFFTQALGGPEVYTGRSMRETHSHLSIEQHHFDLVAKHLTATLAALSVPAPLIDEVIAVVGPLAAEIVNTETLDPRETVAESS